MNLMTKIEIRFNLIHDKCSNNQNTQQKQENFSTIQSSNPYSIKLMSITALN